MTNTNPVRTTQGLQKNKDVNRCVFESLGGGWGCGSNSLTAETTDYKQGIMTSGHALFNPDHRFGSAKQCAATLRVP